MTTSLFSPTLKIAADDAAFSELAASFFIAAIEGLNNPLVILPAGKTPLGMYDVLATHYAYRDDLWKHMRVLQLDEYAGLQPGDDRLFAGWLSQVFLDRVGVPAAHRTFFRSHAARSEREIARIDRWVAANGPADLGVLGIGLDGHLGMNFPGTAFDSGTHLATLPPAAIQSNAVYRGGDVGAVPPQAYTLGLKTLLQARQILVLANEARKAGIAVQTLNGPITTAIPATCLRTRPNVTMILDAAAAMHLKV